MKLKDRVALITGGAMGIGAATAQLFAQEGARVALVDIDSALGEETCRKIEREGGQCRFYQADVSSPAQVKQVVGRIIQDFKQVDILVNNAGIWRPGRVIDLEEETWDQVLGTNLKSVYLVSRYVIPEMVEAGRGVVINVASVAGLVGATDASAYSASKGGIVNLSRSMAMDFAPFNIRVNCLCPGMIDTAQGDSVVGHYKPQADPAEAKRTWQPLPRMGIPADAAKAALYLAADDSEFMTGSIFVIDCGLTAQ
jgi:NAD(P)-dependent dehydrogenase (short-subunit alcohol dehydrogenase family)